MAETKIDWAKADVVSGWAVVVRGVENTLPIMVYETYKEAADEVLDATEKVCPVRVQVPCGNLRDVAETQIAELRARLEVAEEVADAADEWSWVPEEDPDACLDAYLKLEAALERYRDYQRSKAWSSGPTRPETEK